MAIIRQSYLDQIRPFIGAPFIKILTGIRRCGKSTVLELLETELARMGVRAEKIIYINLETWAPGELSSKKLFEAIQSRQAKEGLSYILLDEVQLIEGWERVVNALFAGKRADITLSGSNSKLLSSELATLLSGRYVQFTIRTLSFAEYGDFARQIGGRNPETKAALREYLQWGGFPGIHYLKEMQSSLVYKTVSDIFSSVVLRDVMRRNRLRNADMLERIIHFLFDNTGNMVSAASIAAYFKNQKRKVSVDTVLEYINALEGACVLEKVSRFDIKGKRLLEAREKYYCADISLVNALLGYDDRRLPGLLENLVYLELKRRLYDVYVGILANSEIDFIAVKGNEKAYFQVCYKISRESIEREFGNLLKIKDQYPKYVVSLDEDWTSNVDGVRHIYLSDFLLGNG
ncbi:MAG: ATP-binding protein [Spirochaetaceae bacterium]|jgi:predicted AAA+ superfamily ATPase|nr:ATP-binding protein [Spirochaetaceae bacterium]